MRKEVAAVALTATVAAVAGVAVLLRQWKHRNENRWRHTQRILRKLASECATPVPKLWVLANDLVGDMQSGLASDKAKVGMFPSYFGSLPTGDEKGLHYGINLRGENFLILRAQLGGKNEPIADLERQEIKIPSNLLTNADSKDLFDLIALELSKFVSLREGSTGRAKLKTVKLGFTISSPVYEAAASACKAIDWKKLNDDTVRTQMITRINQALEKHNVEMRVSALVDDVVGDLAGGRYYSRESVAAISLGMGTNVAYTELLREVKKLQGELSNSEELVVNMQWGDYCSINLPLTEFDANLDLDSANPGRRIFEKLISGMYLGEIVRRVLLKMAKETALFGDTIPPKLMTPYLLRSPDMAAMHQDTSEDYEIVDEKLKEIFEINNTTPMVREVVAEICDIVAERGARLVGAGIVGIVKKLGRIGNKRSVITIEGGLYEHYRIFRNYLHSSVWEMLGSELSDNVVIEHSHGGSGAGAIFLAAASHTQKAADSQI